MKVLSATAAVCALALGACATESSRTIEVAKVQSAAVLYSGVRVPISVGKFDNRSSFMRGVFSDGVDRLGSQAKTTLVSHLQQSQRFAVQDRDNMAETGQEAKIAGSAQQLRKGTNGGRSRQNFHRFLPEPHWPLVVRLYSSTARFCGAPAAAGHIWQLWPVGVSHTGDEVCCPTRCHRVASEA